MADKIKLRRDTQANWEAVNPILDEGEIGWITDKFIGKVGDGTTGFNDLRPAFSVPEGWINVKDFGAVGDGITDDTQAIQEAFNLSRMDLKIYFPYGTYRISSEINKTLNDGESLHINGGHATIKPDRITLNGGYAISKMFTCFNIDRNLVTDKTKVTIENINMDGSNYPEQFDETVWENLSLCRFFGVSGYWVTIKNIGLKDIYGSGFYASGNFLNISNIFGDRVGGKWYLNNAYDAFGDGMYIRPIANTFCEVNINNIYIKGYDLNKSRAGIVIEGSDQLGQFIISDFYLSGYDRTIHIEEAQKTKQSPNTYIIKNGVITHNSLGVFASGNFGDFYLENITYSKDTTWNYGQSGIFSCYACEANVYISNCSINVNSMDLLIDTPTATVNIYINDSKFYSDGSFGYQFMNINNLYINNTTFENLRMEDYIFYLCHTIDGIENSKFISNNRLNRILTIQTQFKKFNNNYFVNTYLSCNTNRIYNATNNVFEYTDPLYIPAKIFQDDYNSLFYLLSTYIIIPNGSTINIGDVDYQGFIQINGRQNQQLPYGTTRPTSAPKGSIFFDTNLGKPIWFNGTNWVDATGTVV